MFRLLNGGLDLGIGMALDARTAWVSDIEPGPCKILAERFPDSPNLGDMTSIDWTRVEPVDIICGGTPCQDLSQAGQRAGMRPGTRSGLWESMAQAIDMLRPSLVIWENVRGALSANAYSAMESEPGCLGDGPAGSYLRAAGRVVGDLATLGYDTRWTTVRASDIGAPHRRERLFVLAYPQRRASYEWRLTGPGQAAVGRALGAAARRDRESVDLLPSPRSADQHATMGAPAATAHVEAGFGSLAEVVGTEIRTTDQWSKYAAAIHRWEQATGPAPSPTEQTAGGKPRLSARFVEWLMGLPDGWVTDTGISRAAQLRALGNGVVPQQCAYALGLLMGDELEVVV